MNTRYYLDEFLNLDSNNVPTIPGKILLLSKVDNAFIGELVKTIPLDFHCDTITMKVIRPAFGRFQYTISHKRLEDIYFQVI